jgi:hypothetical protein
MDLAALSPYLRLESARSNGLQRPLIARTTNIPAPPLDPSALQGHVDALSPCLVDEQQDLRRLPLDIGDQSGGARDMRTNEKR